MDKKLFQNLIDILDEEINAYSKMKEYFSEKKEILKKAKIESINQNMSLSKFIENLILVHFKEKSNRS